MKIYKPTHKDIHICNSHQPKLKPKIAKEYVFANAENQAKQKSQLTTIYKNNSGLIAKMKLSKYKKGQCLTEKLVYFNPLLFLY
jgi:hypothetical protein